SLKTCAQAASDGTPAQAESGETTLISRPPTSRLSSAHFSSDGHPGSPGRTRAGRDAALAEPVADQNSPPAKGSPANVFRRRLRSNLLAIGCSEPRWNARNAACVV